MYRASEMLNTLQDMNPDLVAAQFKGYGGSILRTTLSTEQQAKIEATLHSH